MIPVRLEMKNFLPYRSPDPLRFEGIHLACLTGANGAGKSSLLDAITWALWGKARAKRDEDLVHLGQGDMYVQLDFEQEGAVYRVLRRRARGKRGQGTLDLFIFADDDTPNLITEPNMRTTQIKINDLLRLDYDTFTNSAFLQQGKADAFTIKSPAERKKILSDILGLDQWALYEETVKEKLKVITKNIDYFAERIKEIEEELARKPSLLIDLQNREQNHTEAQAALSIAEARLKEVEHAPGELRNAQQNKTDCENRLRDHRRDIEEVITRITRQQAQITSYQEVIDNQQDIEAGYTALQSARAANDSLSDKLRELKSLDDDRYALQRQLDEGRHRLENDIETTQQRIEELTQAASDDHAEDLQNVQTEVTALQARDAERATLDEHTNTLREDQAALKTHITALTAEGQALRDRLERLEATDAEAAACPLCGQPLDAASRMELITQLNEEITDKREIYRQAKEDSAEIAGEIKLNRATLDTMTGELKRLTPLLEHMGVLLTQSQNAQQAAQRLEEEQDHLHRIQAELTEDAFAPDVREALSILDARQTELGYDQTTHDDARQQLEIHRQYDELHTKLSIALESLPGLVAGIEDAQARQDRLAQVIHQTEGEITNLEVEITRLTALVAEYNTREAELNQQRTLERTSYGRVIEAQQALDALEKQAERKHDLETRRDASREEHALYDELRRAFGKNGIPAMIIETVIPELESAANDLLARMTDGRMHLRLTTQREKVTGGIMETLDIEIADELGTRNYELYSGGEAFRINFALRVALSQMLARRAGAHLRTLFIDEGFGTQDDNGRTKLVEAINAIQEEFDMILVITHIDELRDSFPVHIVVDKTVNGSRIGIR